MLTRRTTQHESEAVSFLQDPGVAIRAFKAADLPGIHYINECGPVMAAQIVRRGQSSQTWIADFLGEVIGVITVVTDSPNTSRVKQLAVHPEWQHRGITRQLLARAAEHLRERGVLKLSIDAEVPTAGAQAALGAMGFIFGGERIRNGRRRLQFYLDLYQPLARRGRKVGGMLH